MESMVQNLITGNLKIAKSQAKPFSFLCIIEELFYRHDYSFAQATLAARYLKGLITYQAYCDVD